MKTQKKGTGIVAGLLLLIIGIGLLWWNEGRTVKTSAAITEFSKSYMTISSTEIDSNNNDKAVYVSGNLNFDSLGATDSLFNVNVNSAVISRNVEMYQWEEECTSDDDGIETCTYSKVWDSELIDSSGFESGHENPTTMKYESTRSYANNIKLGEYDIDYFHDMLSTEASYSNLSSEVASRNNLVIEGNYYMTSSSDNLNVGDVRISFTYNNSTQISILGMQYNNSITKYTAKNGYSVARVEDGTVAPETMIQNMKDENNFLKWILRAAGTLFVIFGLLSIISPLQKLASYVPVLGKIANSVSSAIAFAIGLCISFVVIALAWFRYRPLLSLGLIVAGIAIVVLIKKLPKKQDETKLKEAK